MILKFAELSAIEFPAGHCMHAMRHASAQTSHSRDDPGRRCGLVVLAMLLMVVAESEVSAQTRGPRDDVDTGGLTVEAVAGWDGTVDQSMPVPISLLLSNYSGRDLDGTRTLTNPASGDRLSLGKVYISQAGTRTFTSIQALPDWYECYVSLSEAGQLIWRRELPISTGKTFDPTTNFALLIEDSDRRLQLPRVGRAASGSSEWVNNDTGVAGSGGRRVDCLTAKPWQIPKHPGPLTAVQAVVFPEEVADDILNEVQWQAVARWMCQGGTVFVHQDSHALVSQLVDASPLEVGQPSRWGGFEIRRSGLGTIYEYSSPLFDADSSDVRKQITEVLATLSRQHAGSLIHSVRLHSFEAGKADYNRLMVVMFFALYTLFSGLISLLLFRAGRRTIAVYTVTVVVVASILAGILGGILRVSQGDLRLVTVTRAGEGGIVQSGKIEVQSAGSRNTQVTIQGQHADLQLSEGQSGFHQYYHYGNTSQTTCPPFTWQPNLAKPAVDRYEIHVPLTPWGTRQLNATAFKK